MSDHVEVRLLAQVMHAGLAVGEPILEWMEHPDGDSVKVRL